MRIGLTWVFMAANLSPGALQQPPPKDATVAPEEAARRMTVPVFLGARGPFQFVVDTGANRTVIGVETAQRCSLVSD
ncbi:MAG: hypothetical protein ACK44W_11825, partial [Planctomycetota bacterium]